MKLVLHIGSGKTGTTSIQNFFYSNAKSLISLGVLYPVNKSVAPNHILLPAGFVKDNSILIPHNQFYLGDFKKYKQDFVRFKHALNSDIEKYQPNVLVMSAEQLFRDFSAASAINFRDFLKPYFDEIVVVAYVREPVSDYASRISQKMRTGTLIELPKVRDIRSVLDYYENQFPGCIRVNAFDRSQLKDGDVVTDFVSKYVPEASELIGVIKPSSYNESLPEELLFKLQAERLKFQPIGNRPTMSTSAFIAKITKAYNKIAPTKQYGKVRLNLKVEEYLRASATDYLWLKNKYGVTFRSLDYDKIQLPQEHLGNCSILSDIVIMNDSSSATLDKIVPSTSAIACFMRTKRYTLFCQLMRVYRIFIAQGWLGKLKRRFSS